MCLRLKDKVAIVTGATSGIGRGIALEFAKEGAKVVIADIVDKDRLESKDTASLIKQLGGEAIFIKTDVSLEEDVKRMIRMTVEHFGHLDILVNNAGIVFEKTVEETSAQDWDRLMGVNVKGVFLGCKYAIPEMRKVGKGKIINIGSISGMMGQKRLSAYCASKAAVVNLTRAMAMDDAGENININTICPGIIETPMTIDSLRDPEWSRLRQEATPAPRFGRPEDIAHAAVFLASSESDFIVGHCLVVDGGWTAGKC